MSSKVTCLFYYFEVEIALHLSSFMKKKTELQKMPESIHSRHDIIFFLQCEFRQIALEPFLLEDGESTFEDLFVLVEGKAG